MKKSFLPYVVVLVLSYFSAEIYYLLGSYGYLAFDEMTYKGWFVGSLLLYNPLLIFLLSLVYALLNGFSLKFPFAVVFSFLPFLAYSYLFQNAGGAEFYLLPYGLISLFGMTIGVLVRKGWKKLALCQL